MEHNVTTSYLLSGKGDQRAEIIRGKPQQVRAWNKWCIVINPTRKLDILSSVKVHNCELYDLLAENTNLSEAFFDELAVVLLAKIQETQQDIEAIEFEFEGHQVSLSNLVPPGSTCDTEHYYWCVEP